MIAVEAPPIVHVQRITSHSKLSEIVKVFSEAPPVKETKMKPISTFEKQARTNYHISRMKNFAKKAQSPDMNMTLNEIRTGVKVTDKIIVTLFAYTVGVFILFFSMFK